MSKNFRLCSARQLRDVIGIPYSRQHIYRLEQANRFPKRIRLGQGRVVWNMDDVENWIAAKIAARDEQQRDQTL
jgi:prophage regulatory protein